MTASGRPRSGLLLALLGVMVAPPLMHLAGATGIGSFAMFTEPTLYRLELSTLDPQGRTTPLPLAELGPHLGRDARRVILPAHRFTLGETNAALLRGGLPDLARLVCALRPRAARASVIMQERGPWGSARAPTRASVRCAAAP